jgi:anti-sigma B factor antagonist
MKAMRGDRGVFRLAGDIDLRTAPELLERLVAHVEADGRSSELVLDCERMHFIDSTGLSVLVAVQKKTGRSVVLRNVQPPCRRILEITHLDEIFIVEPPERRVAG